MHAKLLVAGLLGLATAVTGLPSATSPVAPDVDATAGTAGTGDQKRSIEVLAAEASNSAVPQAAVDQPLTRKRHELKRLAMLKRAGVGPPYYYQGATHESLAKITPDMKDKHAVNMKAYMGEPGPKKSCGSGCVASVMSFHSMVSQNSRFDRAAKAAAANKGPHKRSLQDIKEPVPLEKRMEHEDASRAVGKLEAIERRHTTDDKDMGEGGMHTLPMPANNKMDDTVAVERRHNGGHHHVGIKMANSFRAARHGKKRAVADTFLVHRGVQTMMTSTDKLLGMFGIERRHPGHHHHNKHVATQQRFGGGFMNRIGRGGHKRSVKINKGVDSIEKRLPNGHGSVLH